MAARAPKIEARTIAGAIQNIVRSASLGTVSSLVRSLTPSAIDWAQPCQPPAYIGPVRHWMWPETLRSSHTQNITVTEIRPISSPRPIPIPPSATNQVGT